MTAANRDSERQLLYRSLSIVDRRLRTRRALQRLGPALVALGVIALILLLTPLRALAAAAGLAIALAVIAMWLVVGWLRGRDLAQAAVIADLRSGLKDLLRTAWSLGARREHVDPSWLAIIEHRAALAAQDLSPRQLVSLQAPRSAYTGVALLVLWASLASLGIGDELLPLLSFAAEQRRQLESDSGMEPLAAETVAGERIADGEESGPPIPAMLRQMTGLEDGRLAELGEIGEATVSAELAAELARLAELTADDRAASEQAAADAAQSEGRDPATLGEQLADGMSADSDLLRELSRELSEASPQRGRDRSDAGGESAAPGEQQARMGGAQEGLSDPDAPIQEVDFPLAPLSTMRPTEDQQGADSALAGAAGQSTEAASTEEGGGPPMQSPSGASTGPQAAPTDPFGEETELEVTLELAILEQQRKQEPEAPERTRRASPQRGAELAHVDVRASDRTRSESALRPSTTPWRYRSVVRRFFAPIRETPTAPPVRPPSP